VDRIGETPNIEVVPRTVVAAVRGTDRLEGVTLTDVACSESREVAADALFIFIGASPRTEILADLVARDAEGFVLTGRDAMADGRRPKGWNLERDPFHFESSVPGIFAAGDARHGSGKRVASAVGEGSATISMVHEYLRSV